jgi:hypothetical protein
MVRCCFVVAALAGLALATASPAQTVKDPAELLPPDTLFYMELTKPADLSKDLSMCLKGSALEDMPTYMSKIREKHPEDFFFAREIFTIFATFVSPEALAEAKRLQGGAFAITGWKKNEPEIVGFLLNGESNVPGFIVKMMLASAPFFKSAGQVDGVPIYAEDSRAFRAGPAGPMAPPIAPQEPETGFFLANMPNMVLMGNTKSAVADVIMRLKSKEPRLNLAGAAGIKDSTELRQRPGLYFYGNPVVATDVIDKAMKGDRQDPVWQGIKEMLNPKTIRSAAASLSFNKGHLELQVQADLDPKRNSPLLDVIASGKISSTALQYAPKDTGLLVTFSLTGAEKNWPKLLAAADAAMKAQGEVGATPAEMVKALEEKLNLSIGKDVLGKLTGISVVLPGKQDIPKGGTQLPMLVLQGSDDDSAKRLEECIPGVVSFIVEDMVDFSTETIDGLKIRSLPGTKFPWKTPLHYGRKGTTIVLGQDRKLVAATLKGNVADSLASEPKMAQALKGDEQASILTLWNWGGMLPDLVPDERPARAFAPPGGAPAPIKSDEDAAKQRKALLEITKNMPPLVATLARKENQLRFLVRVPDAVGSAPKLINGVLDYTMDQLDRDFQNVKPAVPVAPAPAKN